MTMTALSTYQLDEIDRNWNEWTSAQRTAANWFWAVVNEPVNQLAVDCASAWIKTVFGDDKGAEIESAMDDLFLAANGIN